MEKTEGAVKALQFRALDNLHRLLTEDLLTASHGVAAAAGGRRTPLTRRSGPPVRTPSSRDRYVSVPQ